MEAWPSVTRKVVVGVPLVMVVATVPAWTMPPRRKESPGGGVFLQHLPGTEEIGEGGGEGGERERGVAEPSPRPQNRTR